MGKYRVGAIIVIVGAVALISLHGARRIETEASFAPIIPVPSHVEPRHGYFNLEAGCHVLADPAEPTGQWLARVLRQSTGYPVPLSLPGGDARNSIVLTTEGADPRLGPEGYQLEVSSTQVHIRASTSAGLFYGAESLLELLPPQVFSTHPVSFRAWKVHCLYVRDEPRFRWRGLMLDVSRHFFSPREIKQVLDFMALHKLNMFHWHLTDDQGWRIEIKQYPRLTQIGAWRKRIGFNLDPKSSTAYNNQGQYGGYYSQADIRDLVAYAQSRHITIVPEIDLPGHSTAALAAYPQLSCSGGPYSTDLSEDVAAGVFCLGNQETLVFAEQVLAEVMDLFPGQFIHLGGDEVPKQNWRQCARCRALEQSQGLRSERQLQDYFTRRIEAFVNAHGKRLVGWSEIERQDLAPSTVLMDWIGGGLEAARTGHDVVMSPEEYCYLDLYQSRDRAKEPPAAGACLSLEKAYSFEPVPPQLDPGQRSHILGAQATLWTEYIPSLSHLEYMAFPRLCALAEVMWSPPPSRDWESFTGRVLVQEQRLDQLGINYRH